MTEERRKIMTRWEEKRKQKEFFDRCTSAFLKIPHSMKISDVYYSKKTRDVRMLINKAKGRRIVLLDLGCGLGSCIKLILEMKDIDVHLIGSDISPELIKAAKNKVRHLNVKNDNVYFLVSDGERLPIKDNTFDIVVCLSVLHHLPSPEDALKEIKRVLNKNGIVISNEPVKHEWFSTVHRDPFLLRAILKSITIIHSFLRKFTSFVSKEWFLPFALVSKEHSFHPSDFTLSEYASLFAQAGLSANIKFRYDLWFILSVVNPIIRDLPFISGSSFFSRYMLFCDRLIISMLKGKEIGPVQAIATKQR